MNGNQDEHVVALSCVVNPTQEGYGHTVQTVRNVQWDATWTIRQISNEQFVFFLIQSGPTNGNNWRASMEISCDGATFEKRFEAGNSVMFGGSRRSVCFDSSVDRDNQNCREDEFTVHIVLRVSNVSSAQYEFKNQMWPLTGNYVGSGDCKIRMNVDLLNAMNPKLVLLRNNLGRAVFPAREMDNLFDFCGSMMQGWNFGTDQFLQAIRNGVKFGFTRCDPLGYYTRDWDFDASLSLSCYPWIVQNPTAQVVTDPSTLSEHCVVKCENGHPLRRFWKAESLSFEVFLYTRLTNSENDLLMASALFNFSEELKSLTHVEALVTVTLLIDGEIVVQHSAKRIIHQKQETITFVIGEYNFDDLEKGKAECKMEFEGIESHEWYIDNKINVNRVAQMKPNGAEEMVLAMPGHVDGFIECRDKKLIAVNRNFLRSHSEFFDGVWRPEDNVSGDVSNKIAEITDCDVGVVYGLLEIMYHRTLQINDPQNMAEYLQTGQFLLCPFIMHYLELALLFCNDFELTDKLDIAEHYDFETIKFIESHEEYATDVKLREVVPVDEANNDSGFEVEEVIDDDISIIRVVPPRAANVDRIARNRQNNESIAAEAAIEGNVPVVHAVQPGAGYEIEEVIDDDIAIIRVGPPRAANANRVVQDEEAAIERNAPVVRVVQPVDGDVAEQRIDPLEAANVVAPIMPNADPAPTDDEEEASPPRKSARKRQLVNSRRASAKRPNRRGKKGSH